MNAVQRRPVATLLLIIVVVLLALQIIGVYRGWRIVLVGFAGVLLVGRIWAGRLTSSILILIQIIISGLQQIANRTHLKMVQDYINLILIQ